MKSLVVLIVTRILQLMLEYSTMWLLIWSGSIYESYPTLPTRFRSWWRRVFVLPDKISYYDKIQFETPPRVPKLPTIDQLANYGTTAFLKWLGHNNFRAQTKSLCATQKYFRASQNISAQPKILLRNLKYFCASQNVCVQAQEYLRRQINICALI